MLTAIENEYLTASLIDPCVFADLGGITLREYQQVVAKAISDAVLHQQGYSFVVMFPRQSGTQQLALDRELQLLPMICLPALSNTEVPWSDLRLELYAQNRNPGITHLALDAVFLFFTDGWRQFAALPDGELAFGQTLIDAVDQQQPYIHLAQTQKNQYAYQAVGNGLWLLPGQDHVMQILVDAGATMPLGIYYQVQLEYQPRRRMLP